jgi:hypothetical protein
MREFGRKAMRLTFLSEGAARLAETGDPLPAS